jgi:phospholipase/carboxylesterase
MPGVANSVTAGVSAESASVVCVFVHGRNQTPEEMQSHVIARLKPANTAFILPRANDKCWYNALAISPLTAESRAELGQSLSDLRAVLSSARDVAAGRPVVLAGFSQGACLSIEHVFTGLEAPDAAIAFTGCRVGTAADERPGTFKNGLPVYISAGSADPWIPLSAFSDAVRELGAGGAKLRADVFSGRAHEVSDAEVTMLDSVIADLTAKHGIGFGAER